jgi:crotonobetainyl-CoA:carnitine CoA-transferase CaiB-like acyl-CoA transferase
MVALQADPATGEPALVRNIVIDKVTAMTAAQAIIAALLARSGGAGGQRVDIAMLDVALAFLWPDGMMQHTLLADDGRVTTGPHVADGYLVRPTVDGHLVLMATSNTQFPLLCAALGTDWLSDPRFATMDARDTNAAALSEAISVEIARYTGDEVIALLHANDVPGAMVTQVADVHLDPQVQHNSILVEHERPWLGLVREPRPPVHYSATPTALGRHAPKLDEHTDEVLAELGYSIEQLADLRARGAIGLRRT